MLLSFDFRLEHVLLPGLFDLGLPKVASLLFHAGSLGVSHLLQVQRLELGILVTHLFALAPLSEGILIVGSLIPAEVLLDLASVVETNSIESKFEVDEVLVYLEHLLELLTENLGVLLSLEAVGHVERQQSLVLADALAEDEHVDLVFAIVGQIVVFEI